MPRERVGDVLGEDQRRDLLKRLEDIGRGNIRKYFDERTFPRFGGFREVMGDKEFMVRYLLLVAVLDQQAESGSARDAVIRLFEVYGREFFLKPENYVGRLYDVIKMVRSVYKPRSRILRLKAEGFLLLRVGGYLLALINISERSGGLVNYFVKAGSPYDLLNLILNDELLGGLLYEKAARMYVGWISHPDLWVDISNKSWKPSSIPMAIDGHVTKVLVRTGFLSDVLIESYDRPIVKADEERRRIEGEVGRVYPDGDRVMIDFGAFYVGINYCHEENPNCESCPLRSLCRRNKRYRAY